MGVCAFLSVDIPKTYSKKCRKKLFRLIKLSIFDAHRNQCNKFMTGFTNESELWFGEQILSLQSDINSIFLEAIIPYQWHEMCCFNTADMKKRYSHVLKYCLSKYVVCPNTRWDDESESGEHHRYTSILLRNLFIIRNSDVLILVHTSEYDTDSSMRFILEKAVEQNKTIILIDPLQVEITYMNLTYDWYFMYQFQREKYGHFIPELIIDEEDDDEEESDT